MLEEECLLKTGSAGPLEEEEEERLVSRLKKAAGLGNHVDPIWRGVESAARLK